MELRRSAGDGCEAGAVQAGEYMGPDDVWVDKGEAAAAAAGRGFRRLR